MRPCGLSIGFPGCFANWPTAVVLAAATLVAVAAVATVATVTMIIMAAPAHAAARAKKQVHGAIAYEPARRAIGYSYDFKSVREAKVEALKQCADPACEVLVSFSNACGAIAQGPGKPFAVTGTTRSEAESKALRHCGDKACQIVAWACTK